MRYALCLLALTATCGILSAQPSVTPQERGYLRDLAADTWQSLAFMADGPGPLPEDNTRLPGYTSVSNVGLYLASVPAAEALGLLSHSEGLRTCRRVIEGCARLETWQGFPHAWLDTRTLKPTGEPMISPVDLGNYEAGLIVCRQAYPELWEAVGRLITPMNWPALYCPQDGWLQGGWRTDKREFVPWRYKFLAADSRTASFLAVAHGVPARHWESLERQVEAAAGAPQLAPGWSGGGLFMQTLTWLFMDEAGTESARSAANFAWNQMARARTKGLPAWGWSACFTPDGEGYIGYGQFREEVVTPHAAALAALIFPHEAVADLQALERLGARAPLTVAGQPRRWGFRDCLDLTTRRACDKMAIWDQEMLFLACADVLTPGCVRGWFQADPLFAAGRARIRELQVTDDRRAQFWRQVEELRQGKRPGLPLLL